MGNREIAAGGARYEHIDSLRSIAALLVVWLHAEQFIGAAINPAGTSTLAQWVFPVIDPGRAGIVLFFAVSGFVIPSSLRGTIVQGTREFLIRRFFRLYPAYWASIPPGLIVIYWLNGGNFPVPAALANVTMLQGLFGYPHIGPYWTLAIELVFYAMCLGLFWCGVLHRPVTFCAVILLAALGNQAWFRLARHIVRVESTSIQQTDLFYQFERRLIPDPSNPWGDSLFLFSIFLSVMALGTLLRFWHDRKASFGIRLFTVCVIGYWLIFFIVIPLQRSVRGHLILRDLNTYLSHGVPVLSFVILSIMVKIRSRIFAYLGVISYSTYLFHFIVIFALVYALNTNAASLIHGVPVGTLVPLVCLLSIAVAVLTFRFIEKPGITLGRRLVTLAMADLRAADFPPAPLANDAPRGNATIRRNPAF